MSITSLEAAGISEYDMINLRYLALHQIPQLLERVLNNLLVERPGRPVEFIIKQMTDLRTQGGKKGIDEDRDESVRSESSTVSVNSVDMADFLLEFRQAFVQQICTRTGAPYSGSHQVLGRVTKRDFVGAIELISLPFPEKMLNDMFNELDVDGEGSVEFESLAARLNYKIQGRFSSEILKSIFRSVSMDNNVISQEACARAFLKLGLHATDKDLSESLGKANLNAITIEEFARAVHTHCASLPPPLGLVAFARGEDSDSRDLDDD